MPPVYGERTGLSTKLLPRMCHLLHYGALEQCKLKLRYQSLPRLNRDNFRRSVHSLIPSPPQGRASVGRHHTAAALAVKELAEDPKGSPALETKCCVARQLCFHFYGRRHSGSISSRSLLPFPMHIHSLVTSILLSKSLDAPLMEPSICPFGIGLLH